MGFFEQQQAALIQGGILANTLGGIPGGGLLGGIGAQSIPSILQGGMASNPNAGGHTHAQSIFGPSDPNFGDILNDSMGGQYVWDGDSWIPSGAFDPQDPADLLGDDSLRRKGGCELSDALLELQDVRR